jgi:hypothetical protein
MVWELMRNFVAVLRCVVIAIGSSLLISAISLAEESEFDMDLMQNIEDTNDSLASHIALGEEKGALEDAKALDELFAVVEEHYTKKVAAGQDFAEAVDLSKKSLKFSNEIKTFVEQKDFDSAANTATDLSRTCKSCHKAYKKED